MAYRILVTDKLADEGLEILRSNPDFEVVVNTKFDKPGLIAALQEADGIVIRSGTQLTADVLEGQTRLKAIVRAGVGVDNIDVPAASKAGVVVMNTPGGNTISTAEHTMALILSLSRNIAPACATMKNGGWDRNKFTGTELSGKTLGIIGLGRVGLAVAQRARAFEMKIVGFDPFLTADKAAELGIISIPRLNDLWQHCDYITLHTPLSAETRNVVGTETIAKMKKGVRIINCARGGLVDEQALREALDAGQVAGAAFDVFEPEPPSSDNPIVMHPKVLVTPHLGASTEEAQINVAIEAANLLTDYFGKGQVRFSVNLPSMDKAELADLRPYLDLGRRLGMLHSQMDRGTIQGIKLTFRGEVALKNTRLIKLSFAAGWMETAMSEPVNLVSAESLLKNRGITIVEEKSPETADFGTMIQAEVTSDRKTYVAAGTLFGKTQLRLVKLGDYRLDATLDGTLFIFSHMDVPGLIGFMGTTMGKYGVNIAGMSVGREADKPGGEAIGVVNLDSTPPAEALEQLKANPNILSVSLVKLPPAGQLPTWLGGA